MSPEALANEADECRKLLPEFVGRPERPLLFKLAAAFDELALERDSRTSDRRTHPSGLRH